MANPYISTTPCPSSQGPMGVVSNQIYKWGKMVGQTTTGVWQHLKTSPNIVDTAWGKLSHGTKVLTKGGDENVFKQTFETHPSERLKESFACFLSTTGGPLSGHLFVSTKRIAFASDRPLSHEESPGQTMWSYYKVMIPLSKVMAINASGNPKNFSEKYVQIITNDHHEFWYMGFPNHENAMKILREAKAHSL